MSNFFDDYLKVNPIETKPDKVKEKEKLQEDEPIDVEGGTEEDDE